MTANETFLLSMRDAARTANHPYPAFAATEAAIETGWGTSRLYLEAMNVFGRKAFSPVPLGTHTWVESTKEVSITTGKDYMTTAIWVKYNSLAEAFADRISILNRLPIYRQAVQAKCGRDYLMQVSASWLMVDDSTMTDPAKFAALQVKYPPQLHPIFTLDGLHWLFVLPRWSTGPNRGPSCWETYCAHKDLLENAPPLVQSVTMENA